MLQPKKSKYRKQFRGKMTGKASRGQTLAFGDYGIKSLGRGWLSAKQIEAARMAVSHFTKREGRVWLRVFPQKPVTSKGLGSHMGGGKGDIDRYVAIVIPGTIILELGGVPEEIAKGALQRAAARISVKTKIISKI